MNTDTLQRHFADCELPIHFIDSDPRRTWRSRTYVDPEDFFFVDVVTARHQDQYFRFFVHKDASLQLMDKNSDTRHLLLQVRCEPVNSRREAVRHLLMGHDERQLFVVSSERTSSVRDALAALKPREVIWAEQRGWKVVRQGDWFFIPVRRRFEITGDMIVHRNSPIGGPNGFRWGIRIGHPHYAEEQALIYGPRRVRDMSEWRVLENQLNTICVRGKIRHAEHATIELREWHVAVQNLAQAPNRAFGYFD